jgi:hypothetical protein
MGYIYAFETVPGYVKVGKSAKDWKARVSHIASYLPRDPVMVGVWEVDDEDDAENSAHRAMFALPASYIGRRELFRTDPRVAKSVLVTLFGEPSEHPGDVGESEHKILFDMDYLEDFEHLAALATRTRQRAMCDALHTLQHPHRPSPGKSWDWLGVGGWLYYLQRDLARLRRVWRELNRKYVIPEPMNRQYIAVVRQLRYAARVPFEKLEGGFDYAYSKVDQRLFSLHAVISGYWPRENYLHWWRVFRSPSYTRTPWASGGRRNYFDPDAKPRRRVAYGEVP